MISKIINKLETIRISKIPRYKSGSTNLIGGKVHFVDSSTFLHGYEEIFRNEVYRFISDKKDPLIIDCGSNIGLSIIYFKSIFPECRLIGFEPDREIFKVLEMNMSNLCYSGVELHNSAVWKKNGILKFRSEGGYSGRIVIDKDEPSYEVKAIDLKSVIEGHDVDFLKLDIEGAEYDVINSIKDNLTRIQNIFVEYHSPANSTQNLASLLQILEMNGFRYFIREAFSPQKPFLEINHLDGMDLQLNISCIRY